MARMVEFIQTSNTTAMATEKKEKEQKEKKEKEKREKSYREDKWTLAQIYLT